MLVFSGAGSATAVGAGLAVAGAAVVAAGAAVVAAGTAVVAAGAAVVAAGAAVVAAGAAVVAAGRGVAAVPAQPANRAAVSVAAIAARSDRLVGIVILVCPPPGSVTVVTVVPLVELRSTHVGLHRSTRCSMRRITSPEKTPHIPIGITPRITVPLCNVKPAYLIEKSEAVIPGHELGHHDPDHPVADREPDTR